MESIYSMAIDKGYESPSEFAIQQVALSFYYHGLVIYR